MWHKICNFDGQRVKVIKLSQSRFFFNTFTALSNNANHIAPKIGEGIYFLHDIAIILGLDYSLVRRWISGYWDEHFKSTFGEKKNRAINFYSLIEFYTFYKLREKGVSAQELRRAHKIMSDELNTNYPFAVADSFNFEKRKYKSHVWYGVKDAETNTVNLIKADGKGQISLSFMQTFIEKIEYDKNNLATRFFPLDNSKNVVVDPKRQFGQPTIEGTNIKTQTIYHLHLGGETNENICTLYSLTSDKVQDAINFHHKNAA